MTALTYELFTKFTVQGMSSLLCSDPQPCQKVVSDTHNSHVCIVLVDTFCLAYWQYRMQGSQLSETVDDFFYSTAAGIMLLGTTKPT